MKAAQFFNRPTRIPRRNVEVGEDVTDKDRAAGFCPISSIFFGFYICCSKRKKNIYSKVIFHNIKKAILLG